MKTRTAESELLTTVFLCLTPLVEGAALWFFIPRFLERTFGLVVPFSILVLILTVFIFLSMVNVLRYTVGKLVRRWQLDIVFTFVLLVIQFALGEFYYFILPSLVPDRFHDIFWRCWLLPFATWVAILNLMYHKVPKFKEKVERYNQYDT